MRILTLLFISSLIFSCGNKGAQEANAATPDTQISTITDAEAPDIRIQVKGATPGKAYLIGTFTNQRFRTDSAMVDAEGKVNFKRDEPYKPGFYYALLPDQSFLQLLIDTDQTFNIIANKADIVSTAQVEGNLDMELLFENLKYEQEYQAKLSPVNQQIQGLSEDTKQFSELKAQQNALIEARNTELNKVFTQYPNSFFTKFKKAGQNPTLKEPRLPDGTKDVQKQIYFYRTEFWNDVDFSDERLLYTPVIANKLQRYITELTAQNPDSIIKSTTFLVEKVLDYPEYYQYFVNWIAINYEPTKTTLMDGEAVYTYIVQNYITKERAFWAEEHEVNALQSRAGEMAGSLLGLKGQEVQAPDPTGAIRSTKEITTPYLVVFIYNPTCDHCIEETPKLMRFYNKWKDKVGIYAIALDTEDTEWKNFIQKYGLGDIINVFDPSYASIYKRYYVDNTPEIYVLNEDRVIIAKNLNGDQIEEVIQRDMEEGS